MTPSCPIVIRVDASPRIGGGHVMRCLTLADSLASRGASVTFVCADLLGSLRSRIIQAGHGLLEISTSDPDAAGGGWDSARMRPDLQQVDAYETLKAFDRETKPAVIVDHYRLDHVWEQIIRSQAKTILAIDDLANRQHACDILLDQSLGRKTDDYRPFVPDGCTLLLGPQYALLRPEFAAARSTVLERGLRAGSKRRVFVFLGTGDLRGITGRVVQELAALEEPAVIDVVISSSAPSLEQLTRLAKTDSRIHLHVDIPNMARLMSSADVAVGAAGTSSWERCCVGLPTVTLVLSDNQQLNASQLSRVGACVLASSPRDAARKSRSLLAARKELAGMAAAAMAIVDASGTERIADHFLDRRTNREAGTLTLRGAETHDITDIWLWRNDPVTRAASGNGRAISWPDHLQWWEQSFRSKRNLFYIGVIGGRSVGMVRFDLLAEHDPPVWSVSINLASACRGRGIGAPLLAMACAALREREGPVPLHAQIRPGNRASTQAFEHAGFIAGSSREGELLTYMLPADRSVRAGSH